MKIYKVAFTSMANASEGFEFFSNKRQAQSASKNFNKNGYGWVDRVRLQSPKCKGSIQ